jgi:RNA polymerase sigma factor (sigma-70 family)
MLAGETSDAQLLQASMSDPDRFAELYDRHAARLYGYAYRRVGPDVADDVVAETFLAAFRKRGRYDATRADALPWLFGIVSREISRHHRKEKARLRALSRIGPEPPADGVADRVAADVSAQAVRGPLAAALSRLSAGDRDVLLLIAWGCLGYAEVAAALQIPVGTVRSRLNRARRKVREALGGTDPTTEEEQP